MLHYLTEFQERENLRAQNTVEATLRLDSECFQLPLLHIILYTAPVLDPAPLAMGALL